MNCPKCGKELSDTAKFCSGCGAKIEAEQPVESISSENMESTAPTGNVITGTMPETAAPAGNVLTGTMPETAAPAGNVVTGTMPETAAPTGNVITGTMPETAAPTGNVLTGTMPETAADTVSTATLPEADVLPETTNVLRAETVKPDKMKFSPKMLIAAGGGVAAVVIGFVVLAGCTFAKADFSHTFMGNKKYATALMGQQLEKVVNTPALSSAMSAAGAGTSSESGDDAAGAIVSSLASFKSVIPESGAAIEASVSADLSDENLEEFARELDIETDKAKEILEAVKALKVKAGVQFTETGIAAQAAGSEGGNELIKVNALYDAETEAYYISVPAVSDECLMIADETAVIDMDELNVEATDDKAAKEMLEGVLKAYKDSLGDAEITYKKTTFSIGDVEFKGKMSSVTFEDEELADMLSNVSDEFFDSEYADSLGDTGSMQTSIDRAISELEDVDGIKATIENFVNSNNTVAGMRIEFEGKNGSRKSKAEIAYLDTKDGLACSVEADGQTVFELSQEKENKSTGKYTGKISDGSSAGKFTIDYENYREKKMFGQDVALGDYTIKFSGDMFSTEDMPFEKITLKVSDEDDKLNYDIGVKAQGSTISAKLALSEGLGEAITGDSMKISGAYDVNSESDSDKVNGYYTKLVEYLANQTKESEFCNTVPVYDSTLADYLQVTAQRALRESQLPQNYADYDENTVYNANNIADEIYDNAYRINFKTDSGAARVKLYYDKSGKLNILDNAGMSYLENEIHERLDVISCKNAYVEIVVWPGRYNRVCGVSVVMTDDSSNIPANLPNEYNFLDNQYMWGTDEDINFIGSFAVGTCPFLSNGEGGATKAADEELAASVKEYNDDAEKAAKAMSQYTGFAFSEGKISYIDFTTTNGVWRYNYYIGDAFDGDSAKEAAAYMTENVGEVDADYVGFYFEGSTLVGTYASEGNYYSYFAVEDFKRGNTEHWGYMDGVTDGAVIGTYPKLSKMTSIPQEYIDAMAGTWEGGYEPITFTEDELKNIPFSINREKGSINNICVIKENNDYYYFYPNNGKPYISTGWWNDEYHKQ